MWHNYNIFEWDVHTDIDLENKMNPIYIYIIAYVITVVVFLPIFLSDPYELVVTIDSLLYVE